MTDPVASNSEIPHANPDYVFDRFCHRRGRGPNQSRVLPENLSAEQRARVDEPGSVRLVADQFRLSGSAEFLLTLHGREDDVCGHAGARSERGTRRQENTSKTWP